MSTVWRKSKITLPKPIGHCKCMILKKQKNPKLTVIGGRFWDLLQTNHWEFKITDIIDSDLFYPFWIDSDKVSKIFFGVCLFVCFFFCWQKRSKQQNQIKK